MWSGQSARRIRWAWPGLARLGLAGPGKSPAGPDSTRGGLVDFLRVPPHNLWKASRLSPRTCLARKSRQARPKTPHAPFSLPATCRPAPPPQTSICSHLPASGPADSPVCSPQCLLRGLDPTRQPRPRPRLGLGFPHCHCRPRRGTSCASAGPKPKPSSIISLCERLSESCRKEATDDTKMAMLSNEVAEM